MERILLVALGGAVGSVARYLTGVQAMRLFGAAWPVGTFTVNIMGGLLMGVITAWLAHRGEAHQENWRLLLAVGAMGGFTTFSAFSLEVALMLQRRDYLAAFIYVFASVTISIIALFGGMALGRMAFR
ncbi:MAG: fluoride efflux transporter CrcB [Caulobacteraceae bacterium]